MCFTPCCVGHDNIASLLTSSACRFVCREALGEGGREAAAYLRPVPPGAVVYGSGDSSVVVTKASRRGHSTCRTACRPLRAARVHHALSLPGLLLLAAHLAAGALACLPASFACSGAGAGQLLPCVLQSPHPLILSSLASNWVQEQAAALYRLNMEQYASLKGHLLAATAVGLWRRMYACLACVTLNGGL